MDARKSLELELEDVLTDQVAEDIVLTARLFNISEKDATKIVFDRIGFKFDIDTHMIMWSFTIKVLAARKRLEEITKKAHSEHTKE